MINSPLLSIIIPTKDRYFYLKHLLDTIIEFNLTEIEVVIQDNSSDNTEIKEYLNGTNYKPFKYFYMKEHLTVIENCDKGVRNSKGEYVCMIGDDDGFLPELLEFVNYMKKENIDSAIPNVPKYYWPDIVHKVHDFSGTLQYKKHSGLIKELDVQKELRKSLRKGGTTLAKMPCIYHAVVSKKALDKVFDKCATYFPGPSPDMANAVALSTIVKKHVFIDKPLVIAGKGFQSTAGAGARKDHVGIIEEIAHLPKNTGKEWDMRIPKVWTGPTIWAESAIKGLQRMENPAVNKFNFNYLYASFLVFHYGLYKYFKVRKKTKSNFFLILFYIGIIMSIRAKFLFINLFAGKGSLSNNEKVLGVQNIKECVSFLRQS